jgi:hypothetical protein
VRFADGEDSFSIAVPKTWKQLDLSKPDAVAAMNRFVQSNPAFSKVLGPNGGAAIAQGMKFVSAEPAPVGFASNVNVVAKHASGAQDSDLPGVITELQSEYKSIGATVDNVTDLQLAGHQAAKVAISLPIGAAGSGSSISETQYVVIANSTLYVITLAGTNPAFDTIAASFDVS